MTQHKNEPLETDPDDTVGEDAEVDSPAETASDDLSARGWVTIGLFVVIAVIFLVVCLPLIV
ncbi:hypothetical protein [Enemella sp. A6]|uniref:hypothetical protein n=1 Tax=Enemella sp. A6 TaxID=3440152 RepID=UPI003EB98112